MSALTSPVLLLRTAILRSLLGGFVIGGTALSALAPSQAQVLAGQNSDTPVTVVGNHGELLGKHNRAVLAKNVVIDQTGLSVRAARTTQAFSNGGPGFRIHRLDATAGVTVSRGNQSAKGEAIYEFDRQIITLGGEVALQRGSDRPSGARLVIDLTTGLSTIDGNVVSGSSAPRSTGAPPCGGRIAGTLSVLKPTN